MGVKVDEDWEGTTWDRTHVSRFEGELHNDAFAGRGVYTKGKKDCSVQMKYEGE